MNLIEELLNADAKSANDYETSEVLSSRLAKILKKDEPVPVTVRELSPRRINDFIAYQRKKDGSTDMRKSFDASLMVCTEGCVEPDLTDKSLQAHFNVTNAKDLAEILFRNEASKIADKVLKISGFIEDEDEDDDEDIIKN